MEQNKKNNLLEKLLPVALSVFVVALDQITKAIVVKHIPLLYSMQEGSVINVLGNYIRLIHVRNNAVAFSMGSNLPDAVRGILFGIVPLIVVAAVYAIYFKNNDFTKLQRWAICGILGGGIGNLIDRFFRPLGVVDFVDCYFWGIFGMERWPTFNVADMAVVICGILFVITFLIQIIKDSKNSKKSSEKTIKGSEDE